MMKINKILVANRGEIAVRIIKAARELGVFTFSIYSDLDGPNAYHCRISDQALPLHGRELQDTYLNIEKIISLAGENGADAIHPGYGFLSENYLFALAVEKSGLIFIGPGSDAIRLMGNKIEARARVSGLGIPVISADLSASENLVRKSMEIEYPVLIKAAAGGGGKGMRIVRKPEDLAQAIESAGREAGSYFGNAQVFLEKYIEPARHIEFQILADNHGNLVHINERECSIQRRYQKIIEESPSTWLNPLTRSRMGEAALTIAGDIGYRNAGTIEFLADKHQQYYFLEMNTRIQVEHPVTELVSGIDLVKEQIRIADGLPLPFSQKDIISRGHAIEARIYAEDPMNSFLPSPGQVFHYREPDNKKIRIDSSMDSPTMIYPQYDPMILKMISWGKDRKEAINNLSGGLADTSVLGIETNIMFLQEIIQDPDFLRNLISTTYCGLQQETLVRHIEDRTKKTEKLVLIAGFLAGTILAEQHIPGNAHIQDPWRAVGYWRHCSPFSFSMNGHHLTVNLESIRSGALRFYYLDSMFELSFIKLSGGKVEFLMDGKAAKVFYARLPNDEEIIDYQGVKVIFKRSDALPEEPDLINSFADPEQNDSIVVSPMYGKIVKINVREKQRIKQGDLMLTIDSMKIENNVLAPRNGVVSKIYVKAGLQVEVNKPLIMID